MKRNYDDTDATGTMSPPQGMRDNYQQGKSAEDKDEMIRKTEAAGRPGHGHKALEHFIGDWRAEVKCWMEPGEAPNISQATAKGTWTLNGLFLQEDFRGEMMGKAFTGRTLMGYDNVTQMFNSVWVSDMQSSMFVSQGKGKEGNKVISLEGRTSCPVRGDMSMKVVLRVLSPDKHTFEMFDVSQGQNVKTMEITYLRT